MINLYIDKINNTKKQIIEQIKNSDFQKLFTVFLKDTVENINNLDFGLLKSVDFFNITDNFEDTEEDLFFDFALKIIENKQRLFIEHFNDFKRNEAIMSLVEDIGLQNYIINYDLDIDLKNPNLNLYFTFGEIFCLKDIINARTEKSFEFLINLKLDENNILFIENKKVKEVINTLDFLNTTFYNISIIETSILNDKLFNSYLPNDLIFFNLSIKEKQQAIENYKISVFNILKNLTEDDFINMNENLQIKIDELEYLPLDTIKEILQKEE